jgi:hypothetical protein
VKDTGSPKLLFENLDLTPIHHILWKDLHKTGPGRPVTYDPVWDLRALMLRQLLQIPYIKDLVKRLSRDCYLREACGYRDKTPTEAHFTQMRKRVGVEGFRQIESWLRSEALRIREAQPLSAVGLIQAACLDGTDIPAWSSRDPHDTGRGLGDPDARVGRGKSGGFSLGYQSLMMADIEGFALGHVEDSLNVNEKQLVGPLLDRVVGDDIEVELLAGDSQFESGEVFELLESHKLEHVIPWRRLKNRVNPPDVLSVKDRIDVEGPEHLRSIYHKLRAPNESLFGRAKCRLNLSKFTWQGLDNVHIHVCLAMFVAYSVCIVAHRIGRPELRQSIAYFA